MSHLAIARAAHLNIYLGLLREMGVPIERGLAEAGLPSAIEDMPGAYVSVERAMACVAALGRQVPLMELGFLAARRETLDTIDPRFREAILTAPTGIGRIMAFGRFATFEDSALASAATREGRYIRWSCDLSDFTDHPALCLVEWLNIGVMVATLRTVAGPRYQPPEITFVSPGPPIEAAREAFGGTRLLFAQPRCSVLTELALLVGPCHVEPAPFPVAPHDLADESIGGWTFAAILRELIQPYLEDGWHDIGFVAELVGTSPRTLQRRLHDSGRTFSDIVQEARFALARDLLRNSDARIIDVALMAGYQNPQHFSRAFRKLSGVSPRTYRRHADALSG